MLTTLLGLLLIPKDVQAVQQYSTPIVLEQPKLAEAAPEPPTVVQSTPEEEKRDMSQSVYNSCIKTARALGLDIPRGTYMYAGEIQPNATAQVGRGVLLSYNEEHIAVILGFTKDGEMLIGEGNYKKDKHGNGLYTERVIKGNDKAIRGFYNPDNDPHRNTQGSD